VPLKAADFGIFNNDAQQLLWRLQNGELDGYQAKAVVVMIGAVNLLRGNSAESTTAAITACVDEIKKRQLHAQILLFNPPHLDLASALPASIVSPGTALAKLVAKFQGKDYTAHALAVSEALAKLNDGVSVRVIDMSQAMQARETEMLIEIIAAGDPHGAHTEFEVWWSFLKGPLSQIFGTVGQT
jgi:hypothetical protein